MNLKKLSAALLCIVMTISMLSCFALGVSAADHNLGYAVTIEEGNFVGGKQLPNNVVIVNDDWLGKTGRVTLKLDGLVYYGWMGMNAFSNLADAAQSTVVHSGTSNVQTAGNAIYVAPGIYQGDVDVYGNNIRIYGPMAGVCPNEADFVTPNPARPAAVGYNTTGQEPVTLTKEEAALTEAVITGRVTLRDHGINTTIDGFYFTGKAYLYTQQGYKHRTGFYIKNNIFNATTDTIMNFTAAASYSTSYRGDVEFTENRVMGCTRVLEMVFVMDTTIRNNYIDVSSAAVYCNTVEANSIGDNLLIDRNYFPKPVGLLVNETDPTKVYDTLLQGVTISNNIVADASAATCGLVNYNFYGHKTAPGTMLTITGNEFRNLSTSVAPFQFNYIEHYENYVSFRHIINITNNLMDLPANASALVSSNVNGVMNLQGNTYTQGLNKKQVKLSNDQTKLLLYPYYDEAAGEDKGALVKAVTGVKDVKVENELITINVTGQNKDFLNLNEMIEVPADCATWSLYEDETLNTEIKNGIVYLDGTQTDRYLYLEADDDGFGKVYRIHVIREPGTEANLLGVVFNHYRNIPNVGDVAAHKYEYNFNSEENFVDYQIKVSPGATYKLYTDETCATPLEDLGNYIPYGGYKFCVVVTSQVGNKTEQYTVTFNRDASSNDPAVISMDGDKSGDVFVRSNMGLLIYALESLESEVNITLETSPKSTYVIKDKDGKEVSTSAKPAALKLTAGDNVFSVVVTDASKKVKTLTLTIENGKNSSDATITGAEGVSATIANGVISFVGGGDNTNVTFTTRSPYAVCDVYADEARTEGKKMTFTATTTPDGERVIETRAFSLPTAMITNRYFVVCTAEDGVTTQEYELVITKNAQVKDYLDVADPNAWYYEGVYAAGEKGLLIGDGTTFRPTDKITRQEMAMVMVRLIGINPANYSKETLPYADAAGISDWAVDAVKTCSALGIFTGSNDNGTLKFNPNEAIARQDVMVLFARALELNGAANLNRFADANLVADYAKAGVQAVVSSGLIKGSQEGNLLKLNPLSAIDRAEMATICSRVIL